MDQLRSKYVLILSTLLSEFIFIVPALDFALVQQNILMTISLSV